MNATYNRHYWSSPAPLPPTTTAEMWSIWVSTHVQPVEGHTICSPNEEERLNVNVMVSFNRKMKAWFACNQCGHVKHIDVTNMTHIYATTSSSSSISHKNLRGKELTYDGMIFFHTINVAMEYYCTI
jgi:hypothetical protein